MAAKSFQLVFDGYWREPAINGLPAKSGIYGVYASVHNQTAGTVTLNRLIYIGEAGDVRARVANHEKWPVWRRQLRQGEGLCFNAAPVAGDSDRQQVEAAMIFKHKPVCNTEYVDSFPFDMTTIATSAQNALMHAAFTVLKTINNALSALTPR